MWKDGIKLNLTKSLDTSTGGAGGGSWSLSNTILIEPSKDEMESERYKTIPDAQTYIATQSPSITNPWEIKFGGSISTAITLSSYARITGAYTTSILTGPLEGGTLSIDTGEFQIHRCSIMNLAATGIKVVSGLECHIGGGTPAGIIIFSKSYLTNCDFSGTNGFYLFYSISTSSNVIIGSNGVVLAKFSDFIDGVVVKKGIFEICYFDNNTSFSLSGNLNFFDCTIEANMIIPNGVTVTMIGGSAKNITINAGGILNTEGTILGTVTNSGTWNNKGDAYDNSVSGLVATEEQAALDEIALNHILGAQIFN